MGKKIIILALLCSACATFRHNTIPIAEQVTVKLDEISQLADKAVAIGVMTKEQRQQFAKLVMIPAIDGTQKLADCLLNANCKNLALSLSQISQSLLVGINTFVSALPDGAVKEQLLAKLDSALSFITALYIKAGGKVAEEVDSLIYSPAIIQ